MEKFLYFFFDFDQVKKYFIQFQNNVQRWSMRQEKLVKNEWTGQENEWQEAELLDDR
jgi:hypothetical protein